MPGNTFQHSATTPAGIEAVWRALDDPTTWESIPGVDRVIDPTLDASGRLRGFSFETLVGGKSYAGVAKAADREEGRLMAWDIATSELEGWVGLALTRAEDVTEVEIRLKVEPAGLLGSLFFPAIVSAIGSGFARSVEELVSGFDHQP